MNPSDHEDITPVAAPPAGVGQPNPGGRTSAGPVGPRWDGGVGKTRRGRLATIPVLVRWDSAAVIRHALEQQHDPGAAALSAASADNFVITVIGLLPAKQVKGAATLDVKSSSEEADNQARTTEETLEWFMSNSHLLVKGEPSMQPQSARIDADTGTVHLLFRRTDSLEQLKRDVFLVTRFGTMNVQTRFRLKDMVVAGHPDL